VPKPDLIGKTGILKPLGGNIVNSAIMFNKKDLSTHCVINVPDKLTRWNCGINLM
jgi:hypothetical protein